MSGWRVETQGWAVDRSRPVRFTFDGKSVSGFAGDSLASALLAAGVTTVGRSFKYHRPRGFWSAGAEEPNGMADILGTPHRVNVQMTVEPAQDGMVLRSINGRPSAEKDRNAFIDRFARFIPAAFYYKTFMFPDWHMFEPRIRAMAGLGALDPAAEGHLPTAQANAFCDLLVIGAGPAGLTAALKAAEAGRKVILCDDQPVAGGSLLYREALIDGVAGPDWAAAAVARLRELGAQVMLQTTAFGRYEHGLTGLAESLGQGDAPRLWRVRAAETLLASGAIERGLPFANNDRPGVMSAMAALQYLRRYGVAVGRRIIVATNNGIAYEAAQALALAGAHVTVIDPRADAPACDLPRRRDRIEAVIGRNGVEAVLLASGEKIAADAVIASGGFTPTVHLYSQAQGKLRFDEAIQGFVPERKVTGLSVIGAANGAFGLAEVLADAAAAVGAVSPKAEGPHWPFKIDAAWPAPKAKGRIWLDLQNDVTAKDVELAARENFVSVEHLKRYTTLGMANDQGKTSNLPGLALMAQLTGRSIQETGTTTYRPPFVPIPLASFAGIRGGQLMNPVRRLPLEAEHRSDGALFREYGGWLRPAWFGKGEEAEAVNREAKAARESVGLFDGSPLGKIEVIGPDAGKFLDFIYYNTMSTLKPGRCRYGFMLTEQGAVYDDGVLVRLDENRFIVSCSSSHTQGVALLLEEWRQDSFDRARVQIHDATSRYATLTVTGPKSKALLEAVGLGADLSDEALPHMALTYGAFGGEPVRITRVSFTGDRSYELSIRADRALPLWRALKETGRAFDAVLLGGEALMVLRAEKGYIVIGKDTDGRTRPMDLGVSGPFEKKRGEYLGKRSLHLPAVSDQARAYVGLESLTGEVLPCGAHAVERNGSAKRSIGFVTTSHFSPNLSRPIALGLVENGASRIGEILELHHLGKSLKARIAPVCAFDPEGKRLHA
ncbi:2Fe-2S iron-sulfur cluster-binding protein [Xinfangfangia sp. CPCC 101601]|uniref:2Fe-2S iron-sulfur cluster-binding protein n=1 Tax=Pseudogemmobacter lacusdianii TaxID=3069608 RepID=A0ABU0W1L2_9RHOB|nr:2Fe-2S iron-sulfur cluster-binding protein [Xinfangfangia sp. CPCC 101601]MDQ2067910.1 2Fe-2S iron-sulfur cluster-binding protein [Xinfangfangia sp. CPCC 101601]